MFVVMMSPKISITRNQVLLICKIVLFLSLIVFTVSMIDSITTAVFVVLGVIGVGVFLYTVYRTYRFCNVPNTNKVREYEIKNVNGIDQVAV
jgi:uncharacterized membrane protein YoaT (DUF817 family)